MVVMAVVGAAVLAMVSWVALREAQQVPGSFSTHRPRKANPTPTRSPSANGAAPPRPIPPVEVVGDATVADADTAEALAAAAALWHILVDDDSI